MKCAICKRSHTTNLLLCQSCSKRLTERLTDLPSLHKEASYCLQPQTGGQGSSAGEMSIGINITALDFVIGNEILNILHEWEKLIRSERNLTAPALLKKQPSTDKEINTTVQFHLTHLEWMLQQDFVDEYAKEIAQLHSTGMNAARRFIDPVKRIPCPTEIENKTCKALIPVKGDDLLEPVTCKKCKTSWTAARLIAVAMSDPSIEVWLDVDAISTWIGLSERQVRRIIKQHKIPRRGQLYEITAFIAARS